MQGSTSSSNRSAHKVFLSYERQTDHIMISYMIIKHNFFFWTINYAICCDFYNTLRGKIHTCESARVRHSVFVRATRLYPFELTNTLKNILSYKQQTYDIGKFYMDKIYFYFIIDLFESWYMFSSQLCSVLLDDVIHI